MWKCTYRMMVADLYQALTAQLASCSGHPVRLLLQDSDLSQGLDFVLISILYMQKPRHRDEVTVPTFSLEAFGTLTLLCCLESPQGNQVKADWLCSREYGWRSVWWKVDQLCSVCPQEIRKVGNLFPGKGKKQTSWEPPEGRWACQCFHFSSLRHILD